MSKNRKENGHKASPIGVMRWICRKVFSSSAAPERSQPPLKRSAEETHRRRAVEFQSTMSMLNFYINRTGKQLPKSRLATLDRAKDESRKDFGRPRKR